MAYHAHYNAGEVRVSAMASIPEREPQSSNYARSFQHSKPRRPRNTRKSVGWDPTVDIFEDTCATQKSILVNDTGSGASNAAGRRSTLFGARAQRLFTNTEERTQVLEPQPTQEIRKDPRRRTIFVPSDTTIMTVHPGAPLRSNNPAKRPRQSGMFHPSISQVPEQPQQTVQEEPLIRKPPRKSLALAPKRAPLHNRMSIAQQTILEIDVPGDATGKENVPPGGVIAGEQKAKRRSVVPPPTVNLARPRVSILPDETLDLDRARNTAVPRLGGSQHFLPASRRLTMTGPNERGSPPVPQRQAVGEMRASVMESGPLATSARSLTSVSERRISLIRRASKLPEKLSMPKLGLSNIAEHFPLVADDISKPELYEEDWLSHQEAAISNLINAFFDGEPYGVKHQSSQPRQKILQLYQDSSMALLYKRLQASLRFGGLSLAHDTLCEVARFKDDLGQRQRFINFWLRSYSLESLRSVAEVVVGREIAVLDQPTGPVSPASRLKRQTKALDVFLTSFIVRNDDRISKGRGTIVDGVCSCTDESQIEVIGKGWRRSVVRSLMMILLLDKAQAQGILSGNLFQTSSTIKSSAAAMRVLCNLLVPSVGDATRVLTHLGYTVAHTQQPLEEHRYHIENIAVDLRDGVLLTRLVEDLLYPAHCDHKDQQLTFILPDGDTIISDLTQRHTRPLSQHLKYPASSRTVMLYNVQLALTALRSVEDAQNVIDNVTAQDIVDGHRERTVSLLWNLLSRWGLDALVDTSMVHIEIERLRKELVIARKPLPSQVSTTLDTTCNDLQSTALLQEWAQHACALHGIDITNLSTSFASGRAFKALLKEYKPHSSQTVSATLKSLGCSHAFATLFDSALTIPTARTTIPLLAFLASRMLPAAMPLIAARRIQRAWRLHRCRETIRQRMALARIARGCAVVVRAREVIVWAAIVMQRRWRAILDDRWARNRGLPLY